MSELHPLRIRNVASDAMAQEIDSLRVRVVDLTATVAVLEEAILKYGEHRGGCPTVHSAKGACSCGLSAVLGAPSPTPGSAWREMVEALEKIAAMSNCGTEDCGGECPEIAEAALAAARAVMGA